MTKEESDKEKLKDEDIRYGVTVKHKEHEEIIELIISKCKMKDSQKGWVDAVLYCGEDRNTGKQATFVRDIESFKENFKLW